MKFLFITFSLLLTSNLFAQTKTFIYPKPTPPPPPGNIKLLPEYIYKIGQGIDAVVGTISKGNGLQIEYQSGSNMGDFATDVFYRERKKVVWKKNQVVNNKKLILVYLNDGRIYANFDERTNFTSTVKTNEELTDFLLMMMTYGSKIEKEPPQKNQ